MAHGVSRRTVLRGAAATTATAGGLVGPAAAAGTDLSTWFENTSNYDGVVDETGQSEVTIEVGAKGNNVSFAFAPAAVRVDPGTNVVWKWTGKGGSHNVVAEDGSFESQMAGEQGHTFEYTPEETGTIKYACEPHEAMGMKGALVVGDAEVGTSASGSSTPISANEFAIGGSLLLGLLSPLAFGAFLFTRGGDDA